MYCIRTTSLPNSLYYNLVLIKNIIYLFSVLLAWGVRESSALNNLFTIVNLLTVLTVIVAGAFKGIKNNFEIVENFQKLF